MAPMYRRSNSRFYERMAFVLLLLALGVLLGLSLLLMSFGGAREGVRTPDGHVAAPVPQLPARPQEARSAASASKPSVAPTLLPATSSATRPGPGQPAQSAAGTTPAVRVPILMYHYIRIVDKARDPLGYNLSVTPKLFALQMAWLYAHGYHTVLMSTLAGCLGDQPASTRQLALCGPKSVALTFDDGYADAFSAALPVLRRYGFNATFYIISGLVGHSG